MAKKINAANAAKILLDTNASQAHAITQKKPLIIQIDGGLTRAKMVRAGKYNAYNPAIAQAASNPARKGKEEFECRIFHFDKIISSGEALRKIAKIDTRHPWKPAAIEHLLALGERMPHLQRQFPITALGTVFKKKGLPLVACLHHGDGIRRFLILRWRGDDWCGDFAFLGVRKPAKKA